MKKWIIACVFFVCSIFDKNICSTNVLIDINRIEFIKYTGVYYTNVIVTCYQTNRKQTDNTPNLTASGFKIGPADHKSQRIVAISRDLKAKIAFGQKIRIVGTGEYDGIYTVRDVMHSRWTNRIDILINANDNPFLYKGVQLFIINYA